ncbi:small integral membrane protein 8 [Apis dorsata]|uniref:small integral membrane protein 8 n=1 Tax=Apis dorsata TaxID=7462 RepID=UPI0003DF65A9|nr:small integral membrane protein 8 [Apis dorsata]
MNKKSEKVMPGDGLRSLKSTILFRTINYELYIKPNKIIMIFGTIAMFGCVGYIVYMQHNSNNKKYYSVINSNGTIDFKKKISKWTM